MTKNPNPDTDEQRRNLRQQLQTQRRALISMLNPAPAITKDPSFPHSMTMRMLTGKSTMLMLFAAEALPLLLARYITKSSFRK